MAQFKTSRLTGSTPMSSIDTHVNDLEAAVVYAFGFETSGAMTGPVLNVDLAGNIVDIVRSVAAANPGGNSGPGWRMRDSTSGSEFMIMPGANHLFIYKNTGSQGSPTWVELTRIDNVNGQWDPGGDYSSATGVKDIYGPSDFTSGAYVQWDNLDWVVAGVTIGLSWSSGARTRLTCEDDGQYLFSFSVYYHPGAAATANDVQLYAELHKNGVQTELNGMTFSTAKKTIVGSSDPGISLQGTAGVSLDEDDYVELYVQGLGGTGYDGSLTKGGMLGHMVGRG